MAQESPTLCASDALLWRQPAFGGPSASFVFPLFPGSMEEAGRKRCDSMGSIGDDNSQMSEEQPPATRTAASTASTGPGGPPQVWVAECQDQYIAIVAPDTPVPISSSGQLSDFIRLVSSQLEQANSASGYNDDTPVVFKKCKIVFPFESNPNAPP